MEENCQNKKNKTYLVSIYIDWLIDWCLMPTLAVFQFYWQIWQFPCDVCRLIKSGSLNRPLIHKNIRSVRNSHAKVYPFIWRKTHYNITDKNNNVSSEGLDRHYHKYPISSYRTRWDIRDNVCLDLQNCRYSI